MSVRRSLLVLSLLIFILPLVVFARNNRLARQDDSTIDLNTLETYVVSRGNVEQVVSAIGTIAADQTVNLNFLIPGKVAEIYVNQGDYMFLGEPLIRLENDTQQIAYDQALLAVDKARLQFDDVNAPVSEEDITLAQVSVDAAWGNYLSLTNAVTPDDILAAELAYDQAFNTYTDLKAARDQAPGGYGSPTYNILDAQTGAASFNAEIARLRMEALKTGNAPAQNAAYARVVLAQREYDRTLVGPLPFEIDSSALNLRAAESQLRRTETTLNRTTLAAPFDGIVTSIIGEVGGLVSPGLPVITMTDLSPLRLTVQVDEVDIRLVQPGLETRIEVDALPDVSIPAQIEQIAPIGTNVNGIVSYDVSMTLDSTDPRVRVGMTAEANIVVEKREHVLIVPNSYIRLDRTFDTAYVNILRDKKLEEIEITLGLQGQDTSEVISGLSEGDVIAVNRDNAGFSLFGG